MQQGSRTNRLAMLKVSEIPLIFLFLLVTVPYLFSLIIHFSYDSYIPFFIFLSGIIVIFYGSWSSFGSKKYVSQVISSGMPLKEEDLIFINRQQLIMTLIFIGIGGLYMLVAFMVLLI